MKITLGSILIILLFTCPVVTFGQAADTISGSASIKADPLRIIGEITLSPAAGTLCTTPFLFGLIITGSQANDWQHANKNFHGNGPYQNTMNILIATGSLAYVTGNAYCIYLLASGINKDLSFWPVLGFSAAGFAIGAYAGLEIRSIGPALALTTLLPVIYVNALAPHSSVQRSDDSFNYERFRDQGKSYKDYYNSTMSFNINLFSIKF